LKFPDSLDYQYRPVNETANMNFTLKNNGELSSYYEWSIEPPFFMPNPTGKLAPGKSASVCIQFKPNV
jgi:hypothetical protein